MTEEDALEFLRSKGYRLNKAMQYDSDKLYLVKRTAESGKESFTTRRSKLPTFTYKTKLQKEEVTSLTLSALNWEKI